MYANCENITEYQSKCFVLKASIKELSIKIKDALKIEMLNNLGLAFKTYFTIVNNPIWRNKKLEKDKALFMAIKEEKIQEVTKQKASANFTTIKSHYFEL